MPSVYQLVIWFIVGLVSGSLAGLVLTWERAGFGRLRNLSLGLAGALVGGVLFRLFELFPELDRITISFRDVVSAFIGAMLVFAALLAWRHFRGSHPAVS